MWRHALFGTLTIAALLTLAGCGGNEEPTPAPTSTPTQVPPTNTPAPPTDMPSPAGTPVAMATIVATVALTVTAETIVPAEVAPESPLVAPESPLAVPEPPAPAAAVGGPAVSTGSPAAGYWQLEKVITANQRETSIDDPSSYRLELGKAGYVQVTADCNTGRGRYSTGQNNAIRFDLEYTDARCTPDSLADAFARSLSATTAYTLENGSLTLAYGSPGSSLVFAPVIAQPAIGTGLLTWQQLENATYLVEGAPAGDSQAPLINGEFRAQYMPDGATEFSVSLSQIHSYGDLDDDGTIDAVVILVVDAGGSGTFYYLTPVLNGGSFGIPLQPQLLGERVFVRDLHFDGNQVVVDLDTIGEGDAACCPTDSRRRAYVLENDRFKLVGDEPVGPPEIQARLDAPLQAIAFAPGTTSTIMTGTLPFNGLQPYRVHAAIGQQMTATVQSPYGDVWLSVYGDTGHVVLHSIKAETNHWAGKIPISEDYILSVVPAGGATQFTLTVELAGGAATSPAPDNGPVALSTADARQAQSATDMVVYLTFDDGPASPSTNTVLDLLHQYDATADFFVAGQQVSAAPEVVDAEYNAGHGLGSHAYGHASLSGIGRDRFFQEVATTRDLLGAKGSRCLRPPFGATDAYTRAYAAELGYDVVLWDVDSRDWSQPGAQAIVDTVMQEVFPGAIILMHDGGGDRTQTHAALEQLLPALTQQGYAFKSYCRQEEQTGTPGS